jgi:hypothetical protein
MNVMANKSVVFELPTLASDLRSLLNQTSISGMKSDIILHSGDVNIPCHKCILSARSYHFQEILAAPSLSLSLSLLQSGKIKVKTIHPSILREFVNFIYTDECRYSSKRLFLSN